MSTDYKQLEFELYGLLFKAKEILTGADGDSSGIVNSLEEELSRIRTKKYNVAVVGEFRRGKSSLINALLGLQVLPSDATPTTATVNRITYGTDPKAIIYYKDGTSKELGSIEELPDYVTKLTAEREETASTVKEAVVEYPIVICQNHVDIIDTPGLSDDEAMTDVTFSLLKNVDAAIVAVSALAPYAETEKKFVAKLIANRAVTNILFVITFIDQIDEDEYDRVYEGIRERISKMTMEEVMQQYADDEETVAKAHRVLDDPITFGVSSKKALKAFVTNNRKQLVESRFPEFKEELFKILTAGQSVNMVRKAVNMLEDSAVWMHEDRERRIIERRDKADMMTSLKQAVNMHVSGAIAAVDRLLTEASAGAKEILKSSESVKNDMRSFYIKNLSEVRMPQNSAVAQALQKGDNDALSFVNEWSRQIEGEVRSHFSDAAVQYTASRNNLFEELVVEEFMPADEVTLYNSRIEEGIAGVNAPEYIISAARMTAGTDLLSSEPIDIVNAAIDNSFVQFGKALEDFMRMLRMALFQSVRTETEMFKSILPQLDVRVSQLMDYDGSEAMQYEKELNLLAGQGKDIIKDLS